MSASTQGKRRPEATRAQPGPVATRKPALFDDDDVMGAATAPGEVKLAVNSKFAASYDERKRRQELGRARELGLLPSKLPAEDGDEDGESSSEEESEDEGEQLTSTVDAAILQTIEAIRKRDARIYDKNARFFSEEQLEEQRQVAAAKEKAAGKQRLTAKDVLRQQLVEAAETGNTDAFAEDEGAAAASGRRVVDEGDRNPKIYDAEQAALRAQFLKSAADGSAAEAADDLLVVRAKGKGAEEDEEEDIPVEVEQDALRTFLKRADGSGIAAHADEIADPDAFLNAFMHSRAWRSVEEDAKDAPVPHYDDIIAEDEKDEVEVDKADAFEAAYNFRFEEPGGTTIVTHARTVEGSMRRKDDKRKQDRERQKETKASRRAEAEAETRRLMNLKRTELRKQMEKIQGVAGNGVDEAALASALMDELDADFDPAAYDAKMAALFGDTYYGKEETEAAPVAAAPPRDAAAGEDGKEEEDEDGDVPGWVYGDGPRPAWAGPSADELAQGIDGFEDAVGGAPYDDDEGQDEGDAAVTGMHRTRKHKRKAKAARVRSDVARVRAILEEQERNGTADDPDEVLQLGFEDVIAGGIKTRFKYAAVEPSDYGLTTDDILALDDKDLNAYVGLKRIAPFRDQEWVVPKSVRKHKLRDLRRKVYGKPAAAAASSAPATATDAAAAPAAAPDNDVEMPAAEATDAVTAAAPAPAATSGEDAGAAKKRRRRHKKHASTAEDGGAAAVEADAEPAPEPVAPPAAAGSKRRRDEEPASSAPVTSAETAAPVAPAVTEAKPAATGGPSSSEAEKRRKRRKAGLGKAKPGAITTLPSGVAIKKSRLAAYAF